MKLKTCVHPTGKFTFGIHQPVFRVHNLRESYRKDCLGYDENQEAVDNQTNFPHGPITVDPATPVFEILNAFPFRGATYITKSWADAKAGKPHLVSLKQPAKMSLGDYLVQLLPAEKNPDIFDAAFESLPDAVQLAVAVNTTDPLDLVRLAQTSCRFVLDDENLPVGLYFTSGADGITRPMIHNRALFEAVANNLYLPDAYKKAMVLKPGIQGPSEIVGEYKDTHSDTHVFEYLRKNSYIPWGHFAANMADDAIRYRSEDLTLADIIGMRHLYYQRTYVRLAGDIECLGKQPAGSYDVDELELLRLKIIRYLFNGSDPINLPFNRTLWGWNFGFDYAPSRYRLHASHQQVHQQYALVPTAFSLKTDDDEPMPPPFCFGFGDLVEQFIGDYFHHTGNRFFDCYEQALRNNCRMDNNPDLPANLIVFEDKHILLFVPKSQTSQWELQLMTKAPVGNILEAGTGARRAIDHAIFMAIRTLGAMGAKMITGIESAKRLDVPCLDVPYLSEPHLDQRLLYFFLPRLPESPGAFSESQLRWINGHYPEDFAAACRNHLPAQ